MFVAAVASTALFSVFANELVEGRLATADAWTREWAAAARSSGADAFFEVATKLGSWYFLLPLCAIAAVLLFNRRNRLGIIAVVLSPLLGSIVLHSLRAYYSRPRPSTQP